MTDSKHFGEQKSEQSVFCIGIACWRQHTWG